MACLTVRVITLIFSQWVILKYSPVASIKVQKYMRTIFNEKLHDIDLCVISSMASRSSPIVLCV